MSAEPDNCLAPRPKSPNSVQSSSLLAVRLHRLNFYVVLRKLISKLQACCQCIQETSMVRFYSSIHLEDKVFIMRRDGVLHDTTPSIAAATLNEDRMLGRRTRRV